MIQGIWNILYKIAPTIVAKAKENDTPHANKMLLSFVLSLMQPINHIPAFLATIF